MESDDNTLDKNTKYIITGAQVEEIESKTAELEECIQSITQSISEVKDNTNKISDITEAVRKIKAD